MLCPKNSCDKHYNKDITEYCEECRQKICKLCKELHEEQGHNVKSLHQKAAEITLNLSTTIKTTYLPQHTKQQREIQKTQKINERLYHEAKTAIWERKDQLLKWLEEETKMQLRQCEQQYREARDKLMNLEEKLSKTISEYNKYANFFENTASTTSSFGIVETAEELESKLKNTSDKEFEGVKLAQYFFQSSELHKKEFKNLFGSMKIDEGNITPTQPKHFALDLIDMLKCQSNLNANIVDVIPTSKTSAWINVQGAESIDHMDTTTKSVTKTIKLPKVYDHEIDGIAITRHEDVIMSHYKTKCLWKWSKETNGISILYSNGLYPYGLCSTSNDSVLVCLNETDPHDDVNKWTPKSKRIIAEVDYNGHKIKELDGATLQLKFPIRVAQSPSGDIAVVDHFLSDDCCVMVASYDGKVKSVYKGQEMECPFDPMYISYDQDCRLLVCDYQSSAIHMLDKNGDFLKFLLKNAGLNPFSFSIYEDRMWVGTDSGIVCVYALNSIDKT